MFEENLGLAHHIAFKYYTLYKYDLNLNDEDLLDMKQEALEELWLCQSRFKGGKFNVYASKCMAGRMKKYASDRFSPNLDNEDFKDYYEEEFYVDFIEDIDDVKEYERYLQLQQVTKALDEIKVDRLRYVYNKRYARSDVGKYAFTLALEGLTEVEIANMLNSDRSNIRKAINDTVDRIKYILKEEKENPKTLRYRKNRKYKKNKESA